MPTDGTWEVGFATGVSVASVTLQPVDEGRLSLDDTLGAWLPEIPDADQITVRTLLDRASGLGNWYTSGSYISSGCRPNNTFMARSPTSRMEAQKGRR